MYPGLIALGPQLYLGLAFGTILYPIMKMYPGFAAFGSFVLGGSCPGYIFVLWAGHPGYVFVLGAGRPGYVFVLGAGISSYTYKSMAGMGLAALGSEKYIGQCPGHKQVLGSGNPRYTGRADYDLGPIPITKSLLLRFTSPHSQKINYRDSGFVFA